MLADGEKEGQVKDKVVVRPYEPITIRGMQQMVTSYQIDSLR